MQNQQPIPTLKILGSRVDMINFSQIIQILQNWIETGKDCNMILVTGFHGLYYASKNPYYKKATQAADLWVPDGIAPVIIAKLHGIKNLHRTPGMEVMNNYFNLANGRGYSSFFYGDTEDTLEKMKTNLLQKFPNHKIAGMYSPPFRNLTEEEDEEIVRKINATCPDVVWVGLGLPKQDIWAFEHKEKLNAKVVIGVGAAFGFLAGKVPRCPRWIGENGFEWVYRFLMEPKKLLKRDLIEGPRFIWDVFAEKTGIKKFDYQDK